MNDKDNFDIAYNYMLENEGGFSNHVSDKGGATRSGISLSFLRQMFQKGSLWVDVNKDKVIDKKDLLNLTPNQIKNIYYEQFWIPICKISPLKLLVKVFDTGVNIGVVKAIKLLQEVVESDVDGIVGPRTLIAIEARDPNLILQKFVSKLRKYYVDLVSQDNSQIVFIKGWINRAKKLPEYL